MAALWTGETGINIDNLNYYLAFLADGRFLVGARDVTALTEEEDSLTSLSYSLHSIKVGGKGYIAILNADNQTILYHPDDAYVGKTVSEAGLDAAVMNDGYEGWVSFSGEQYFCESRLVTEADTDYQFIALRPRAMMEANRVQLVRDLTREVKLMFDKHHINIPFPQVVINKPSQHEKATVREQLAAQQFVDDQKIKAKNIGEALIEEEDLH